MEASYESRITSSLAAAIRHGGEAILSQEGHSRCDYEMITGEWGAYEEMWHTGQLIQGLLAAYRTTGRNEALRHARRAGDWWVGQTFPEEHPLHGYLNGAHGNRLGALINTTTIMDGTPGLFDLTAATGDSVYAQVATDAGAWILDHLYIPEERLSYNIVDAETGEIWRARSPHAQHQGRPFELRFAARPNAEGYLWADMYRFTGEQRYLNAFLEVCDGLIARQSDNGWWMDFEPNDNRAGKIHARFNTWNAEALLEAYDLSGDKKYLQAALRTGEALARIQQSNGVIFYQSYTDGNHDRRSPCGSGTSFAGILWLRLHQLGAGDFADNIRRALDFTLTNQFPLDHPDPNLAGGYLEIRQKESKGHRLKVIFRDISTSFGLRFLSAVHEHVFGSE